MLNIKIIKEVDSIIDFAFDKSIDPQTASYPRRFTRPAIVSELQGAVKSDTAQVFAIYEGECLCGVFSYFWEADSNYMQTTFFLIDKHYSETATKAIAYMKADKENYKLFIGVPSDNKNAVSYLSKFGTLSESSYNTHLGSYTADNQDDANIIKINKENFHLYQPFHDKYALKYEMYWNGYNLEKAIEKFDIFAYSDCGVITGSIFAKNGKHSQEIYGLFSDKEDINVYNKLLDKLLRNFANESENISVTYFVDESEDMELENAKNLGFTVKDIYRGFEL